MAIIKELSTSPPDPDLNRFPRAVVEIASKRAAQLCSNPECGALTCGPSTEADRSVTVGEAAHIYGANPGAARYDPGMVPAQRRASTNAIWLCRNCHKLIDADAGSFPAALLFKWRDIHEGKILQELGKTNERLRRDVIDSQFQKFGDIGFRARQIIIDRPDAWEFRFTAELLQYKCKPVLNRLGYLKAGLYSRSLERVDTDHAILWISDRFQEICSLIAPLMAICNSEFHRAWGAPGVSGSPDEMVAACNLFAENCDGLLRWEEKVRFVRLPEHFEEIGELLIGVGARALEQVAVVPDEMSRIFSQDDVRGEHEIKFVVDVPEGWECRVQEAMERLEERLHQ